MPVTHEDYQRLAGQDSIIDLLGLPAGVEDNVADFAPMGAEIIDPWQMADQYT